MYYPVMLNLQERNVAVVGGGQVAERKISWLLEAGAKILVISPEATTVIKEWSKAGKICWHQKTFSGEDIVHAFLVFACTDSMEVNRKVLSACRKDQLLCMSGEAKAGDFIVPSVLNRGRLQLAVSTSGASPSLSKKIIRELGTMYEEAYGAYVEFLYEARRKILEIERDSDSRKTKLSILLDERFYSLTKDGMMRERDLLFERLLNGRSMND
ncbi:precorrin-2 dehydrogenase/sirohydrochlorin ferrochelatase family protein [Bacillus massilinigeriensis]|uniref:precorrin-2 dehydrogenase/sirohydrochlorin ferrochelatase family protein n=1 Tax=Bacillus mediterraneensis TaxID=1805474 RepID=UPI0008F8062F|nr:NAD(P)-dependent oxidoreductase [Bacillus mediterraneensis]